MMDGLELAPFGYVPGGYANVCRDCPKEYDVANARARNLFDGAKFSTRCKTHAQEAKDRYEAERGPIQYNFGQALCLLRAGTKMRRTGWNGKGMWIDIQFPDAGSKMTEPYIYMRTAQGGLVPWLASQADILTNDWEIAHG